MNMLTYDEILNLYDIFYSQTILIKTCITCIIN